MKSSFPFDWGGQSHKPPPTRPRSTPFKTRYLPHNPLGPPFHHNPCMFTTMDNVSMVPLYRIESVFIPKPHANTLTTTSTPTHPPKHPSPDHRHKPNSTPAPHRLCHRPPHTHNTSNHCKPHRHSTQPPTTPTKLPHNINTPPYRPYNPSSLQWHELLTPNNATTNHTIKERYTLVKSTQVPILYKAILPSALHHGDHLFVVSFYLLTRGVVGTGLGSGALADWYLSVSISTLAHIDPHQPSPPTPYRITKPINTIPQQTRPHEQARGTGAVRIYRGLGPVWRLEG